MTCSITHDPKFGNVVLTDRIFLALCSLILREVLVPRLGERVNDWEGASHGEAKNA